MESFQTVIIKANRPRKMQGQTIQALTQWCSPRLHLYNTQFSHIHKYEANICLIIVRIPIKQRGPLFKGFRCWFRYLQLRFLPGLRLHHAANRCT